MLRRRWTSSPLLAREGAAVAAPGDSLRLETALIMANLHERDFAGLAHPKPSLKDRQQVKRPVHVKDFDNSFTQLEYGNFNA